MHYTDIFTTQSDCILKSNIIFRVVVALVDSQKANRICKMCSVFEAHHNILSMLVYAALDRLDPTYLMNN